MMDAIAHRSFSTFARMATVFLLILTCGAFPVPASAEPVVHIDSGALVGHESGSVNIFQAIPFAAPPIGAQRFAPPQPVTSWTAPRDASRPGARCEQDRPDATGGVTSEDCLFLNVYAPKNRGQKLPVMVEIYGGGFVIGSANDYDGSI